MKRHTKLFAVVMTLVLAFTMMFASISVNAATVKPKALYLKATATTVDIGGSVTVSVSKVNPTKASKSVSWKSSNTKVATVSSAGKVVGKKTGTVTITATSKVNKKVKKTIKIYVKDLKATSVTLDAEEKELFEGATTTLKATVKGAVGFKNQGAEWSTSDASVATVSQDGTVTTVKPGTATITAKDAAGGTKSASCTVTVKEVPTVKSFEYGPKTVFVNPAYVAAVQKENPDAVILDVCWGEDYSTSTHVKGAVHMNSDSVENDDCDPWPMGDGYDDFEIYGRYYVDPDDNFNIRNDSQLGTLMRRYGITSDTEVVITGKISNGNGGYGPLSGVTRVAYALINYGVKSVRVVDGGTEACIAAGVPMETKVNKPNSGGLFFRFGDRNENHYLCTIEEVQDKLVANPDDDFKLVSIRSEEEFKGETSGYGYIQTGGEPLGAVWGKNTDTGSYTHADGTVVTYDEMKTLLAETAGVDMDNDKEVSFYCGTGWRATIPFLIAYQNGNTNVSMYDGGWYQWELRGKTEPKLYPVQKCTPEERKNFSSVKATGKTTISLQLKETYDCSDKFVFTHKADGVKPLYSSSDSDVATVDEKGIVTAKAKGSAVITVSFADDSRTVKFNINVRNDYNYVTAKQVFDNLGNSNMVLLDSRKVADYAAGHIPGAVSASTVSDADPSQATEADGQAADNIKAVVDKFKKDKQYVIVCYSGNRYAQAAAKLLKAEGVNNENIVTLGGDEGTISTEGGMKAWNANYPDYVVKKATSTSGFEFVNNATPEQLKADITGQKKYTVIDLRDIDSYAKGSIPGAASAPLSEVDETGKKNQVETAVAKEVLKAVVDANPNGLYTLICYSGNSFANYGRNILVNELDIDERHIITLEGGFAAWSAAGFDTEKHYNYVNAEYVHSKLGSDSVVLVDVRKASDYNTAHVPGAVSASCESAVSGSTEDGVAADNIKKVVDNYGKNKEYILLCYSGNRYAREATACLLNLGVSSRNIKTLGGDDSAQSSNGGMKAWRAHYPAELTGEISNDTTAHTVTLQCQVANNSKAAEHWFIVSKGGSMEENTVLTTNVSTDDFYYALEAVAGSKVWNSGSVASFEDGITLDQLVKGGDGNADFAKFDVTVSWGGNTYKLSDVISEASHNGKAYDGTYDIAFAGNLENQHKAGTGCITCFGGCFMGITSGHDTPMMIGYTPKNLPAVGETVTVTYTLK